MPKNQIFLFLFLFMLVSDRGWGADVPATVMIGPKVSDGLRACFKALQNPLVKGIEALTNARYTPESEPILMVADLSSDPKQLTQGYFVYSEKGTLYYPQPKKPNNTEGGKNVWYLSLKSVPGFSQDYERENAARGKYSRNDFQRFVIQENPRGALDEQFEKAPPYSGPYFHTSNWWSSQSELQNIEPVSVPAGKNAEEALVNKLKANFAARLEGRTSWINELWARASQGNPPWRIAGQSERTYKERVVGAAETLIERLNPCATTKNNELSRFVSEKTKELQNRLSQIKREIDVLPPDSPEPEVAEVDFNSRLPKPSRSTEYVGVVERNPAYWRWYQDAPSCPVTGSCEKAKAGH